MAQSLKPFRQGTRQRFAKVGVIPWTTGTALTPLELPRVGMLSQIYLRAELVVTLSAAGALADLGPWNVLNRIKVNANIGSAAIVDLSGFGTYMVQPWYEEFGFRPDNAGIGSTSVNADTFAAPVAMGANNWIINYAIPISANSGREFDLGLINLQAPETRVTVEITTGQLTDAATNVTSITGSIFVYYIYYEIGNPAQFALPPLSLVRLLEEQQSVNATGDNLYTLPRQGVLMQLAHRLTLNSARTDANGASWDEISLRYNKTDTVYRLERRAERLRERIWYGLPPLAGVSYHDFWHAASDVSAGDFRDAVDLEELSTCESVVTVSTGATLGGAGTNILASVRRILQILE